MPDDQNQKPSTIDDLVKELSKNSKPDLPDTAKPPSPNANQPPPLKATASQGPDTRRYPTSPASDGAGPPPNLPGVRVEPKPFDTTQDKPPIFPRSPQPTPPRSQSPLPPVGMPPLATEQAKPAIPTPPTKSQPVPPASLSPAGGLKPSPIQEYKSSIRTMGEDIMSIKSGQKPAGVDVPKRITPDMPQAPLPSALRQEAPLTGSKQTIDLGQAEKSGTLPGVSRPKPSVSSGSRQSVGLGQAENAGPLPIAPTSKKPSDSLKPFESQPPIVIPREKKGPLSPKFYMIIAGILVVGGFIYWFFVLKVSEPKVVTSPTLSPVLTATPTIKSLGEIFGGSPVNFEVTLAETAVKDFKIFVDTLNIPKRQFSLINLMEDRTNTGTLVPIDLLDMFDMTLMVYPAGLKENIIDSTILAYGQSEAFNPDGTLNFDVQDVKKVSFVARVKNKTAVQAIMADWESTIIDSLAELLSIADVSKETSVNFLDNLYRGIPIRYKNFPFPDVTVDYSIVNFQGQVYLAISGSREAMYTTIDALLEQ